MSINQLSCSPNGQTLIKKFEGLRLTAYQDMVGVWTIGYGHTGPDVKPGLTITQQQADQLLINDLVTLAKSNRTDFLQIEPVQVGKLLDDILDKARGLGQRQWLGYQGIDGVCWLDGHQVGHALSGHS